MTMNIFSSLEEQNRKPPASPRKLHYRLTEDLLKYIALQSEKQTVSMERIACALEAISDTLKQPLNVYTREG